jgi:Flp pilus assembly pilin Flp
MRTGTFMQRPYRLSLKPLEENGLMTKYLFKLRVIIDTRGQDLIEYALMAGFVAVAAGAIMPDVATSISQIFSKVASVLSSANNQ